MNNVKVFILVVPLLLFTWNGVYSQEALRGEVMITDRPDLTESSVSIPIYSLQVESGLSYTFDSRFASDERTFGFGETLIRYGLLEGMELRLGFDYSSMTTSFPFSDILLKQQGFSPITIGSKINLTSQNGWMPEMALLVHIQVPLFNSDFRTDYAVPNMILAASHSISESFSLGYNLGMEWSDNNTPPVSFYSIVGGYGLSDRIGVYLESSGRIVDEKLQNFIDGGLTFLILPNLQYDLSAGIGVTPSSPEFFVATGISFRLPY